MIPRSRLSIEYEKVQLAEKFSVIGLEDFLPETNKELNDSDSNK